MLITKKVGHNDFFAIFNIILANDPSIHVLHKRFFGMVLTREEHTNSTRNSSNCDPASVVPAIVILS